LEIHLEPERIVFTAIALFGLGAQIIYYFVARDHARRLSQMKIGPELRLQLGPHWAAEYGRLYVMTVGAVLGFVSFTAPTAPRTLFSVTATILFTGVILEVMLVAHLEFRRRRRLLNGKTKR
jgi:hypothetical protein